MYTLGPDPNGRQSADDILKNILIHVALTFVSKGPVCNFSLLVHAMARRRPQAANFEQIFAMGLLVYVFLSIQFLRPSTKW